MDVWEGGTKDECVWEGGRKYRSVGEREEGWVCLCGGGRSTPTVCVGLSVYACCCVRLVCVYSRERVCGVVRVYTHTTHIGLRTQIRIGVGRPTHAHDLENNPFAHVDCGKLI